MAKKQGGVNHEQTQKNCCSAHGSRSESFHACSTSASPGAEQNTTVGAAEGYTYKIATVRLNDTWPTDFLTDGVMGDLAKEADIDIEWQIYYSNDFGEQKALLFASDDLPDAFFGSCGLGDSDIVQNKEKLLELRPCPT